MASANRPIRCSTARRFEKEMNKKARVYGKRYPLDEDFLKALETMPPATRCGDGFRPDGYCWRRARRILIPSYGRPIS